MLPILDYGDILYQSAPKLDLVALDSVYYRAACSVSGVIHGSNATKVLRNINWQTLGSRRKYHMNCYAYRIYHGLKPPFLLQVFDKYRNQVPILHRNLRNRQLYSIPARISKRYENSSTISIIKLINQNNRTFNEHVSLPRFKVWYRNTEFQPYTRSPTTHIKMPIRHAKFLNRARVGLLLNSHRFAHNFLNTPNPSCPCGFRTQSEKHFLLDCTRNRNHRTNLLRALEDLDVKDYYDRLTKANKVNFLLYGNFNNTDFTNDLIIKATSKFIFESKYILTLF